MLVILYEIEATGWAVNVGGSHDTGDVVTVTKGKHEQSGIELSRVELRDGGFHVVVAPFRETVDRINAVASGAEPRDQAPEKDTQAAFTTDAQQQGGQGDG